MAGLGFRPPCLGLRRSDLLPAPRLSRTSSLQVVGLRPSATCCPLARGQRPASVSCHGVSMRQLTPWLCRGSRLSITFQGFRARHSLCPLNWVRVPLEWRCLEAAGRQAGIEALCHWCRFIPVLPKEKLKQLSTLLHILCK